MTTSKSLSSTPSPRRQTVEFLRQFARVYVGEQRLAPGLGNLVIN